MPSTSDSQTQFVAWSLKALSRLAWLEVICGLLGGSCQVAPGRVQTAAELALQQGPSQEVLACMHSGWLWSEITSKDDTPKGQTWWAGTRALLK